LRITQAMVLCAGKGTRLSVNVPKCMVKVGGRPLLEYTVSYLEQAGVKDIIINLCYQPEVITNHFGDGSRFGVNIRYSCETELLGTAGGVARARYLFPGRREAEPFLVWYGDNMSTINLARFAAFYEKRRGIVTIATIERENTSASGVVYIDEGEDNRVISFEEKPKFQTASHWINAGIYILRPQALEIIPTAPCDFGYDVFPPMLRKGWPMYAYQMGPEEKLWWVDTPSDLAEVHHVFGV